MENNRDTQNFSDAQNNDEFEDITSSSSPDGNDIYSFSSFSGKGDYRKKKRGGKLSNWWRKLKKGQKALLITLTSILLILATAFGVLLKMFDYNYNKINTDDLGFENVIDEKIINVALFGIDTRSVDSFKGNSDSIMVLSLNTATKKVKVISIMRDTLVPITYNGNTVYSKINSAYARGGPELAIKTINSIFNLDISEYATVNFFGMVDIIDAVGGIDAELTENEVVPKGQFRFALNGCISEICNKSGKDPSKHYITEPGKYHLNGIQAVAYSRIRKVSNIWGTTDDYGRTDRQRYVMEQLFNKAVKLDKKNYVKLAKALIPCSETSLSYNEIMGLAFDILLKSPTFEQMRIPMTEYLMPSPNTPAGSVVYFDLDYAAKIMHAFIYNNITPEEYMETNGIEKNDWYRQKVGYYTPSTSSSTQSGSTSAATPSSEPTPSTPDVSEPLTSDIPSDEEPADPGIVDSSALEPGVSEDPGVSSEPTDSSGQSTPGESSSTPAVSEPTPSTPGDGGSQNTATSPRNTN